MPNRAERIATLDEDRAREILMTLHKNLIDGHVTCEVIEAEKHEGDVTNIAFTFEGQLSTYGGKPWTKAI